METQLYNHINTNFNNSDKCKNQNYSTHQNSSLIAALKLIQFDNLYKNYEPTDNNFQYYSSLNRNRAPYLAKILDTINEEDE